MLPRPMLLRSRRQLPARSNPDVTDPRQRQARVAEPIAVAEVAEPDVASPEVAQPQVLPAEGCHRREAEVAEAASRLG